MAAGAKALGTERRESPVFPPVRGCVPDCSVEEAPAPPGGFRANLGHFRGLCGGQNGAPAEAQRKRVRWGEEEQWNERVFALWGGNEGYGACDDERQDKGLVSPGQPQLPAVRAVSRVSGV